MQLDVVILKIGELFEAKSPAFPLCKGKGKTEKEALKVLNKSISKHLAKSIESLFDDTFNSETYTQIIANPLSASHEQHRIYDLLNILPAPQRKIALQLRELPQLALLQLDKQNESQTAQDIHAFLNSLKRALIKKHSDETQQNNPISVQELPSKNFPGNDFILGIPLSLN